MTWTFKLARRLAVSRTIGVTFGMLPVFLLFVACSGGDATAPDGSPGNHPISDVQDGLTPRDIVPVAVTINPSRVTAETNQLIRFLALGRSSAGERVAAPIVWHTSGGTILPDGRFSSAAVGTFMITGRTRSRGEDRLDTATVVVVRRQPLLASIHVTPATTTLAPGAGQEFLVTGRMKGGRAVPVGAVWKSGGGAIDAGGNFVAGDTAGTFRVIATNPTRTLSDTVTVIIVPPAPLPPPPAAAPAESTPVVPLLPTDSNPAVDSMPPKDPMPPTPVLGKVILIPASATLSRTITRQFAAYGRTTAGDSVPVSVVFVATGGSVTSKGLYTAGSTAGTFRVIAASGGIADTSTITITVPLSSGTVTAGIPFGEFHVPLDSLNGPSLNYNAAVLVGYAPTMKASLDKVRARKARVILALARLRTKDAIGRLSVAATQAELAKWAAAVDLTPYIADGTVVGVYVTDDIAGAVLWGGEVPPLARIDSLALAVKTHWPNAITMVRAKPTQLTGYNWRWLETAWSQYNGPFRDGPPEQFRDSQVAAARALKLGLVMSFNTLAGGCGPTSACLPGVPGTDILGVYANAVAVRRFQLSAAEVLYYGKVFLAEPYVCASIAWQWSPIYTASLPAAQLAAARAFDTRADVRASMAQLSVAASQRPNTSCRQR